MNTKNLIWIVLIVVVGFSVFNIVKVMTEKPQYNQVSFRAVYTFNRDGTTTMENDVAFAFNSVEEMQKSYDFFQSTTQEEKIKSYKDVLDQLSEKIPEKIEILNYSSESKIEEGLLVLREVATVKGFQNGSGGKMTTGFGENQIQLQSNSQLIFVFPDDAEIISMNPLPEKKDGNILYWDKAGTLKFPIVEYE